MNLEDLVRGISSSLVVQHVTLAPFAIGRVSAERIGFADIPCVVVTVDCRPQDVPGIVPVVRARVFRELAERGWDNRVVDYKPSVQQNRRRQFVDGNESSPSHGRKKFGNEHRFSFEVIDPEFRKTTWTGYFGRYAPLPDRRST